MADDKAPLLENMDDDDCFHAPSEPEFVINWTNINYVVSKRVGIIRREPHHILKSSSGKMKSGTLVGLLGPSGCGKTSLMEILVGFRESGVTGMVTVDGARRNFRTSFIPQSDPLVAGLTTKELILFTSRIMNFDKNEDFHRAICDKIITTLKLTSCADTVGTRCSGGQQKRISLALDLVNIPQFLVLDEPTSGLDYSAGMKVIQMLRDASRGKLSIKRGQQCCILVSIHQPSWKMFSLFDQVIIMGKQGGQTVYDGNPFGVSTWLTKFDVPQEDAGNPADLLMEVACGVLGPRIVHKMIKANRGFKKDGMIDAKASFNEVSTLSDVYQSHQPSQQTLNTLFRRVFLVELRDPFMMLLRLTMATLINIVLVVVFGETGRETGCPYDIRTLNDTGVFQFLGKEEMHRFTQLTANSGAIFFWFMFHTFLATAPTVFVFPKEFHSLKKEISNKWYSFHLYFAARILADLAIIIVFLLLLSTIPLYIGTHQNPEWWRFLGVLVMNLFIGLLGQSHGAIFSSMLVDSPAAAIFVTFVTIIPFVITCGYFVSVIEMTETAYFFSYFNFFRSTLHNMLILLYGFNLCGDEEDNMYLLMDIKYVIHDTLFELREMTTYAWSLVNTSMAHPSPFDDWQLYDMGEELSKLFVNNYVLTSGTIGSKGMTSFGLEDMDFIPNCIITLVGLLFVRGLTYYILLYKIHCKK